VDLLITDQKPIQHERRPPKRDNPAALFKVVCRGNTQGDLDDFTIRSGFARLCIDLRHPLASEAML
jgi:hypothetical protein